jgi:hypothetical protein
LGQFEAYSSDARDLVALRGGIGTGMIAELSTVANKATATMEALSQDVEDERAAVEQLRSLLSTAQHFSTVLSAVEARLPEYLPGMQSSAPAKSTKSSGVSVGSKRKAGRRRDDRVGMYTDACLPLVTSSQFAKIPAYMKGRATIEAVNERVSALNSILRRKAKVMGAPRSKLNTSQLAALERWDAEEKKVGSGKVFFSAADLKEAKDLKSDSTLKTTLTSLRHLKTLAQVGGATSIAYLVQT